MGKKGWRHTPIFQRSYGRVQRRITIFPIWSLCWSPCQLLHHIGKRALRQRGSDHHPTSTQTEGGSGYHPSLKLLQDTTWARALLEYELIQETQELAERYKHKQAKQARRDARQWAQMIYQTEATFQEVFSQASLTEAVKLLPWCVSTAVPFCYISRAVTIAAQQDEGIPTMSDLCPTASEPEPSHHGSLAPGTLMV